MNRVSRAMNTVVVVGSTSIASPEGIFRSSRGEKAAIDEYYRQVSLSDKDDKAAEKYIARVGRDESIKPNLSGGNKLKWSARQQAPSAAILVRPGEHVPIDFGSEFDVPMSPEMEQWVNNGKTAADILFWFQSTKEGKSSRESVDHFAEQLKASQSHVADLAIHGSEKEYSEAVNAAQRNAEALKVAEQEHFDRAHAKYMLAKPKEESKGNTAKVVKSVLDELIRPGEHLPARATPKELRKIGVDNRGNLTGKPSADRVRDTNGDLVLVEPIELSAEDLAADKSESAQHKIQKTSDKAMAQIRQAEARVSDLERHVAHLEAQKLLHGLGDKQAQDLKRYRMQLVSAKTHLATLLEPVRSSVRHAGIKVKTDIPEQRKPGTRTCTKHEGRVSCKCHLLNFEVTVVDGQRNIVRRRKVA